jgi:hypothetical protein
LSRWRVIGRPATQGEANDAGDRQSERDREEPGVVGLGDPHVANADACEHQRSYHGDETEGRGAEEIERASFHAWSAPLLHSGHTPLTLPASHRSAAHFREPDDKRRRDRD